MTLSHAETLPPATYDGVAKTLHWLTALLIFTAFPLGLLANDWPYASSAELAMKGTLFSLHKTVGIATFLVALLRILWALTRPKPGLLHPERRAEAFLAEMVHWLLYGALVLVPLTGWIDHAASEGFAPILWPFGQGLPLVPKSPAFSEVMGTVHEIMTKVLLGAVILHVAGALKHHVVDRDATLRRMLPGRAAVTVPPQTHSRAPLLAAAAVWVLTLGLGLVLGLAGEEPAAERVSAPAPAAQTAGAPTTAVPPQPLQTEQTAGLPATAPEQTAPVGNWAVEPGSSLGIGVRQFGSDVKGSFDSWTAVIEYDPEDKGDTPGQVAVQIEIGSLRLGSVSAQAMGPEFFDAATYPTANFAAAIRRDAAGALTADGTLTLKGKTQPVTMPIALVIEGDTAQMTGTATLDRRDFGIGTQSYNDEATLGFPVTVTVDMTAQRSGG